MRLSSLQFWKRMNRSQLPPEKRLSGEAVTSITIHSFYQLGASMSGVFLNLYLWRLTNDLFINGMYSLIGFLIGPLAFAIGGKYAKTRDRLFTYRLGIFTTSLFYLLVILAGERVVDYYVLFAILNGIAGAFYWLGYLTLIYDVSTEENRIRYLGLNSIAFNLAGLAGPAIAGTIIGFSDGLSGYMIVFTIAFVMFVVTTIGSFRLKTAGSRHKTYYLRFMPLLFKRDSSFREGLFGWFFIGMFQGLMLLLPNILLFSVLEKEQLVGYMGAAFLGLTVLTSYVLSRHGRSDKARAYIIIAATGFTIGCLLLLTGYTTWTVISFMALYYICAPLQMNSYSAYHYGLVARLPLKGNLRIETIVGRETFINLGRVISIFILIVFSEGVGSTWMALVLLAAALMQYNFVWILGRAERKKLPASE